MLWQGESEQALSLLSMPPPSEVSIGEFAVRGQNTQAEALIVQRRHVEAEEHLREAETLASRTAPEWRCETLRYKGYLAYNQNQFAKAEEYFNQSLRLARQFKNTYIEAQVLGDLGLASTHLGRFDEAVNWYSDALSFARPLQYRMSENISIANLGWNYRLLGDFEKAISYFSDEMKVVDSLGQDQLKEDVLSNLGDTYNALGNYSAAQQAYLKALEIARLNKDKFYLVIILSNVATAAFKQGHLDDADEYSRQASALDPREEHAVLIRAMLAAARHRLSEAKSSLQQLIADTNTEKYIRWEAQSELANVYAAENERDLAEGEFQKLIHEVEAGRSGVRVVENRLAFSTTAGRFYDDYVRFLVVTGQSEKAFQVAEFSRARTLAEGVGIQAPTNPSDISIKKIQRSLGQQNEIILAYWLTPDKSFLWFVSPSHFDLFILPGDNEIERQIREYNETLQGAEDLQNLEQQGQSLYALLVEPVEKLVPRDAKVVIVPDGGLTKLNFETLRVPHPTPHFWIQDVELEAASSSLFVHGNGQISLGAGVLVMGNPIEASNDYPALPYAPEELKRVEAHFTPNQRKIIDGKQAIPSAYASSHPERFGLIHFVTHGTASDLSPLESAIILSRQAENDFKLYARDIVKIPLKADLVTISACYGLGRRTYSGEGLVGLAWAFLRAGAHQIVAGLWEVDDRAAVDLMDDFYTGLQKWKSASKALRAAKLKMVTSDGAYHRPYYWASLQLYTGS